MFPRFTLHLFLLAAPLALHAADQDQEYQQVRTIALRDPRVREAYEDADRRLAEKIVKIDPALEGYVKHRGTGVAPLANSRPAPATAPKPAASAKPFVAAKPVPAKFERSHVVLKGETLTSIASIFGVTVQSLKTTNHIQDERKLQVGQNLVIPDRTR